MQENADNTVKITVRLYGKFRNYFEKQKNEVHLTLAKHSSLAHLREALKESILSRNPELPGVELLDHSVFANETQILRENTLLKDDAVITILPPVCGG